MDVDIFVGVLGEGFDWVLDAVLADISTVPGTFAGVFARVFTGVFTGVFAGAFAGFLAGAFDVVLAGVFVEVFVEVFARALVGPGFGVEFVAAADISFELGVVGVDATPELLDGVPVGVFLVPGVGFVVVGFFWGGGVSAGGFTGILIGVMGQSLSSSSEYISSSTTSSWPPPLIGSTSAS